jgi:FKBP-type peptidyl-prolyl cis-trans isomerase FklB
LRVHDTASLFAFESIRKHRTLIRITISHVTRKTHHMRSCIVTLLVLFLITSSSAQQPKLATTRDSISYSIGIDIAKSLKMQGLELNAALLTQAIRDVMSGSKQLLTDQQAEAVLTAFQRQLMLQQQEEARVLAEKNKHEGDAFLEANKKKEGVTTLPSGLQYKVLVMGKGKKPKLTDSVVVHYRGTFVDGKEFDNTVTKGEPATFVVNEVIAGWKEALQLMPVGSRWQLFVPSGMAFGERGAGQLIPPNAALIFEVELVAIK